MPFMAQQTHKDFVTSITHMKRGSIGVSDETQRLTNDLLLFRVKVLEGVIPGAYNGQRDGEGIQQVLVLSEEKAYNLSECQW